MKVQAAEVAQGKFHGLGPERIRFRDLTEDLVADFRQHRRTSLPQLESRLEKHLALREALPDPERLSMVLGYHTGIRLGVLRELLRTWIDLEHKRITIPSGIDKNKQPRVVPTYGDMGPYVDMALANRNTTFPQCPYVVQRYGHQVVDISKAWAKACAAVGLEDLRFHDLRRSAVRNMDRAGVPRDVAMRIIGHKTASMLRRYNIISDHDLDEAGLRLEACREQQQARLRQPDSQAKRSN